MNVLFFSPGFPAEMPHFVRGLAEAGARVIGLSEQPAAALPAPVRASLADHVQVERLWDEAALVAQLRELAP
ncbi:MAG TPA: hypothetical protein VJS92_11060, partial [Candidatus Polarisedimenticolaceae bacterium]|nr:hypothetical protein [Candidatus Polarisedimenticolaceae bacterium]